MPIQTRTEMLTTGFRSKLGIKVFGPDLDTIQNIGVQIEKALTDLPDTRSVFAERTTGGYFLDFTPNRQAAARYGLTVGDVNDVIETAIGGKTIAKRSKAANAIPSTSVTPAISVTASTSSSACSSRLPTGTQVPMGELADFHFKPGRLTFAKKTASSSVSSLWIPPRTILTAT